MRRSQKSWVTNLAPISIGVILLAIWCLLTYTHVIDRFSLPTPTEVLQTLWNQFTEGRMVMLMAVTLAEAAVGACLGSIVGVLLGYVMAKSRLMKYALGPYIAASQALPLVAVAPLLIIWVGYGFVAVTLLCSLLVFFPVTLATRLGIVTLDSDITAAARLDGASGWKYFLYIEIPLAAPALLTGIRNGFTLSITGAVVGEMVIGGNGLGQILAGAGGSFNPALIFATIVILTVSASVIFSLFVFLEKMFTPQLVESE